MVLKTNIYAKDFMYSRSSMPSLVYNIFYGKFRTENKGLKNMQENKTPIFQPV